MTKVLKTFKAHPLVALAVACALVLAPISAGMAKALDGLNLDSDCKLNLKLPAEIAAKVGDKKVDVDIYKIASINEDGHYALVSPFDTDEINDQLSAEIYTDSTTGDQQSISPSEELITKVSAVVKGSSSNAQPVESIKVGSEGASADGLDCGLYLVMPKKLALNNESLSPKASIISLPTKSVTDNGSFYSYIVGSTLKMEISDLTGELEIVKSLKTMNASLGNPTFVFHVKAVAKSDGITFKAGDVVYDNNIAISFTEAGKKSTKIEIPSGCEVTVTEVYSGSSYTVVGDSEKKATISVDEVAKVQFTNDYNDDNKLGSGIDNIFKFDETTNGFNWTSEPKAQG